MRQKRPVLYEWERGPVAGVLLVDRGEIFLAGGSVFAQGLAAWSDSVAWSAVKGDLERPMIDLGLVPFGADGRRRTARDLFRSSITDLEPTLAGLLRWATKATAGGGEMHRVPAMMQADHHRFARPGGAGDVRYEGFDRYRRRWSTGWTLETLHGLVAGGLDDCESTWGWSCPRLVVLCSDGGHLGLAYRSGTGKETGVRRIALSVRLLDGYGPAGVRRVVLHELCHHWREEAFPKGRDDHDTVFCRELARVDPATDPHGDCHALDEEHDATLVAAVKQRKEARIRPPVWRPEAGTLRLYGLRDYSLRIAWEPGPGYRWTRWAKPPSAPVLVELAGRFTPEERSRVQVRLDHGAPVSLAAGDSDTTDLQTLLRWMVRHYPRLMGPLADLLRHEGVPA
jgi:hypothetical protein